MKYLTLLLTSIGCLGATQAGLVNPSLSPIGGSGTVNTVVSAKATFSAVGDGTTDDTKSLQSALDYTISHPAGILYIPPGVYLVTGTLTNWPNQSGGPPPGGKVSTNSWRILGDAQCSTVIDGRTISTNNVLDMGTAHSGWELGGISVIGPNVNGTQPCNLNTTSADLTQSNSVVVIGSGNLNQYAQGLNIHDCYFLGGSNGLSIRTTQRAHVRDCFFAGSIVGLNLSAADEFQGDSLLFGNNSSILSTGVLLSSASNSASSWTGDVTFINPGLNNTFISTLGVPGFPADNSNTTSLKIVVICGDQETPNTNGLFRFGTNYNVRLKMVASETQWNNLVQNSVTNYPWIKRYGSAGNDQYSIDLPRYPGQGSSSNNYPVFYNAVANTGAGIPDKFDITGIPAWSVGATNAYNAGAGYIISNSCSYYPNAYASVLSAWTPSNIFSSGIVFWYDVTKTNGLVGTQITKVGDLGPNGFTLGCNGSGAFFTNSIVGGSSNYNGRTFIGGIPANSAGWTNACGYLPQPTYYIIACGTGTTGNGGGGAPVFNANPAQADGHNNQQLFRTSGSTTVTMDGGGTVATTTLPFFTGNIIECYFHTNNSWMSINGGPKIIGGSTTTTNGQQGFAIGINASGVTFGTNTWNQVLCFTNWNLDPGSPSESDRLQLLKYVSQRESDGLQGY